MAVILYQKGNRIKVGGIPCDFQVCNEHSYLHLLDQGWFYTPEECYAEEKQENDDNAASGEILEETETPETEETTEGPVDPDEAIRAAAKYAGISHWHNKSIERLVNELKELEDAE